MEWVRKTDEYKGRQAELTSADYADSLSWDRIGEIIDALSRGDTWFSETGIEAVDAAIKSATSPLPDDPQRVQMRRVIEEAWRMLAQEDAPAEF
jgi:hypothetical protein